MKKKYIILLGFCLIFLIVGLYFVKRDSKFDLEDSKSKAVYIYNLTDDKKVYGKNENKPLPMASLTKIMTLLVSLDHVSELGELAPIDYDSYMRAVSENASMAGFLANETTTYRDLMYGTILASGAEAADSLAVNVAGSIDSFVDLMNEKAGELNLKNTSYANADGMDDKRNFQSAKDCAMLIKYGLEDGNFRAIFTKRDYLSQATNEHPDGVYIESTIFSHLKDYEENGFEIIGGKSGTTDEAGLCWATLAEKDGKEYIIVVMGVSFLDIDDLPDAHIRETLEYLERI